MSDFHDRYVLGFCFDADFMNVVLIRKNRPDWQKGKLNGVGGKIESNEAPIEAMIREFREETGLSEVDYTSWTEFGEMKSYCNKWHCWMFFAQHQDLSQCKTMTDEPIEIHPVDKLPDDVVRNLRYIIPSILDEEMGNINLTY